MEKFITHTGIIVPLYISNIDTDAIIPKQFLKKVTKKGFGKYLFNNWRYLHEYKLQNNNNFVLNNPIYKNSSILLTGKNFGCGSSREHAVWALKDFGFKVIIAPSFADIFYTNAFNNQLLLIVLNEKLINTILSIVTKTPGIKLTVNLKNDYIMLLEKKYYFKIDNFYKFCMLNGLDSIDHTLREIEKIKTYENEILSFFPKILRS